MKRGKFFGTEWLCILGGLTLIAQAGCAPVKAPTRPVTAHPQAPTARSETPSREALPGLIVMEIEGKRAPERLFSFSLRDADIREVLMALSKQTSFNIVVKPTVKGIVTVDLEDVTLIEALDILTDLLDLTYTIKQSIVRVFEPVPVTRIFSLQYVSLKRTASSSTSAQIGASGGGGGGSGATTVTTSTDTDLWKDIEAGVEKLLSKDGTVIVDKQSGNILVTDLPKVLDRVASFLESIEGSVQRQVLIEAKIIEVVLTGEYRFGIDWGAIVKAGALRGASPAFPGRIFGQSLAPETGDFQVGVTSTDFDALLSLLSKQGEVNVLSSPKLATLNNQTAVIRSATDEVFFEKRVVSTPGEGGRVVETEVTPRTVTIGVVLSITPQISSDGNIILHIRPTVTESSREKTIEIGGDSFSVPIVDVREADLVVRAREGQVVVIGGLIQERKRNDESKVPILGDLPIIGRLFRSTTQEVRKTELVILLSATLMVGKKVDEITSRELERLKKFRGSSPW